jgi:hypothetical protein
MLHVLRFHSLLQPEYKIADPICTFIFSVLVVATTFSILKDTLGVLMEGLQQIFLLLTNVFIRYVTSRSELRKCAADGNNALLGPVAPTPVNLTVS